MKKESLRDKCARLESLVEDWEPKHVAETLRREMDRLKRERDGNLEQKLKEQVESLRSIASGLSKEMAKHREFTARHEAGLVGYIKRLYRHVRRFRDASDT